MNDTLTNTLDTDIPILVVDDPIALNIQIQTRIRHHKNKDIFEYWHNKTAHEIVDYLNTLLQGYIHSNPNLLDAVPATREGHAMFIEDIYVSTLEIYTNYLIWLYKRSPMRWARKPITVSALTNRRGLNAKGLNFVRYQIYDLGYSLCQELAIYVGILDENFTFASKKDRELELASLCSKRTTEPRIEEWSGPVSALSDYISRLFEQGLLDRNFQFVPKAPEQYGRLNVRGVEMSESGIYGKITAVQSQLLTTLELGRDYNYTKQLEELTLAALEELNQLYVLYFNFLVMNREIEKENRDKVSFDDCKRLTLEQFDQLLPHLDLANIIPAFMEWHQSYLSKPRTMVQVRSSIYAKDWFQDFTRNVRDNHALDIRNNLLKYLLKTVDSPNIVG